MNCRGTLRLGITPGPEGEEASKALEDEELASDDDSISSLPQAYSDGEVEGARRSMETSSCKRDCGPEERGESMEGGDHGASLAKEATPASSSSTLQYPSVEIGRAHV